MKTMLMTMIVAAQAAFGADQLFNDGWSFCRKGETPVGVSLPHDAAIAGPFDPSLDNWTGLLPYFGEATYAKTFSVKLSPTESRYLVFEGVMSCSKVFVNGQFAAERPYGYATFRVALDAFLKDGENEVRVELAPPRESARWYPGFGIYRDVWLQTVDRRAHVGFNGICVRTEGNRAKVEVEIEGTEAAKATWSAHIVGEQGLAVAAPKLWSPETPNLYELEVVVSLDGQVVDTRRVRFGFRTLRYDVNEGFFLNGVHRQMKGVCQHHDLGSLGAAFDRGAMRRQIAILKEMGCDAIRTSHNPPAPGLLDLCDEMGMMVMDEAFDMWENYKSKMDYARFFKEWHERDLVDFLKRDRNHPCIVMWSIGNEVIEHATFTRGSVADGLRIGKRLTEIVHRYDDRPTTSGYWNPQSLTNGMAGVIDVFGANYLPERYAEFKGRQGVVGSETCSMVSSRGEYFFPLGTNFLNRGKLARCSDGYRNNQVSSYDLHPQRTNNYPPDWEFEQQERNPHVYGEFVWTGFDYLGETDPIKGPARSSYYGIIDLCGFPKDRYYCYQAHWRPDLPMAHIVPNRWNFEPSTLNSQPSTLPVHVYTSGDEAELFVNGVSQGRQKKARYQYRFMWDDVVYQPGEVKVVTWKNGKPWASETIRTAGAPADVKAACKTWGDLDYWDFTAVDAQGVVAQTGALRLTFDVTDGELVGVGNGDPTDHDSLKGDTIRTFHGLAQAIVRRRPGREPKLSWTVTRETAAPEIVPEVTVMCEQPGDWRFATTVTEREPGVRVARIVASAPTESLPPEFKVVCKFPQLDCANAWNPNFGCSELLCFLPWWGNVFNVARTQPLKCFFTGEDVNRLTVAADELLRELKLGGGLREEDFCQYPAFTYFSGTKEPMKEYVTEIRLDSRPVAFADAVRAAAAWQSAKAGGAAAKPPADAYEPLYSTWYNFHKEVTDKTVEAECRKAAELGMKVVILDDGWQCDEPERSYKSCGDWRASKRRFPDMRAHVSRVHAMGMKYMVWFSMPFVGEDTDAWKLLKGKALRFDPHMKAWVLDPRFPEVRAYLRDVYLRCLKEWDIDGFKLDFIDAIAMEGAEDPALKENYAGRDCRAVPEGVERLLKEVTESLSAVKPNLLFEFRQAYVGPVIRKYGNIVRVGDCPGSLVRNRVHIANMRLLCEGTSVHSDMLRWNEDETPENAARFILNSLFGTVQYSAMLSRASEPMQKMLRHWIAFERAHRATLLEGAFRPHRPALDYPVIEAESAAERIVVVYDSAMAFDLSADRKTTIVINATGRPLKGLVIPTGANVQAYDTYGEKIPGVTPPPSGYISF